MTLREGSKRALATMASLDRRGPSGMTVLIYHRVGAGTTDELDLPVATFEQQLDILTSGGHDVVSLDDALDRLDAGSDRASVVLTFDDGFSDVRSTAFPLLAERGLPFTLYLAAGLVGGPMTWEGSIASSQGAASLTWDDIGEMHASGLCTVGNHTYLHTRPAEVDTAEIDRCTDAIEVHLGAPPSHFAWTWGVPVPRLEAAVRERFRSVATGDVGRNLPEHDRHALRRVPVRASDPVSFFDAKVAGSLWAERGYAGLTRVAKGAKRLARRG